jgi:enoyl-CoA hydratase/carnithine racemase
MAETTVLCEAKDGVAELTLNRPERMNAFSPQMAVELIQAFRRLGEDDSVRVIVVTGAGRAFCAGADLGRGDETFAGRETDGDVDEVLPRDARARNIQPWKLPKPVIAAINGHAIGVGLTLALQFDIRIAAVDAKLSFAFVQRGIMPEMASTYILPRLIGIARASDLLLTGRIFLGEEAARLGVVNEALEREQVLPRAREIARFIVEKCAPASVALTKRMIWEHLNVDDPLAVSEREARGMARLGRLPDAAEGVLSFIQKRRPEWKLKPSDAPDAD